MNRATFDETMMAYKRCKPFQPFTISLINGDRFEVDYPEALLIRDGLGVFAAPGGIPFIFDWEGVCHIEGDLSEKSAE